MKTPLLVKYLPVMLGMFVCFALCGTVKAQNPIPNGDFETWDSATYQYPQNYPNNSNADNFFRFHLPFNVTKTSDAYHGTQAVQLTTNATATDTAPGYFININPNAGPSSWTGGMPYNQKPTGIRGWYKYNVATADSGTIMVSFSKAGSNVGIYFFPVGGIHNTYTLFNFTFSPALAVTPDSVVFGALSCKLNLSSQKPAGPPGSTLILDSVSFTGVGGQPALMNGDFESWQSRSIYTPASWFVQSDNGHGFNRTTDAHAGKYAMQLTTYLGDHNNQPVAQPGMVSTGYHPDCPTFCPEEGGYPFSNQVDTLVFYYKYAPSNNDSANVNLFFKKNGSPIWGQSIFLHAAPSYQYMSFPFNTGTAPDSVMIDIQSSNWTDSAVSYVGSDLKIDDMYFKSQLHTGVKEINSSTRLLLYPNPVKTYITLEIDAQADLQGMELRMYDLIGRCIETMAVTERKMTWGRENVTGGMYFYEIRNHVEILKTGKLIVE